MIIRLSAPSKTFLTGEYAVLNGGPALIINTEPRFTLTATKGTHGVRGIPSGSPAARWIEQRSPLLRDWHLEFTDPHGGQGGFGASSAQFLFVHAVTTFLQISVSRALEGLDLRALWNDFQVLSGGRASGADLLAQATGLLSLVDVPKQSGQAKTWPYAELDFAVLRTRNKVPTHTHLETLDRAPLQVLVPLAQAAAQSFGVEPAENFLQHVKSYARALTGLGLQSTETQQWLGLLQEQPWCKVTKGCGALGADTVLAFFATADQAAAHEFFRAQGWEAVASMQALSPGLQMQWSWN